MKTGNVIKYLEQWAPPGAAWEKDNIGVQIGSKNRNISKIFLCLELTEKALKEAIKKNCNFIITHHPFIFAPLKRIDTSNHQSQLIETLIKNDITLFSAHTNLDFTKDGVSYTLVEILGLKNIRFLENEKGNQFKLVVFVPEQNMGKVSEAMYAAGAGQIGEYNKCGFHIAGQGTFEGNKNSNPVIGKAENFEKVNEIRLETLVDAWKLDKVISAMLSVHPYEEPTYDIYILDNQNSNYGYGAVGEFDKSLTQTQFLELVCKKLKTGNLRYSKGKNSKIKKVAVCGGSGADMIGTAIANDADAYLTADIKYHSFHDAEGKILLIDAGHYETEVPVLNTVKEKLEKFFKENGEKIEIVKYSGSTNPVKFYNNKGDK
ncbi:MAG: Nif3-like dinuclear metal center hexameric protein [Rhodothermaceae bacterium]